MKLSIIIPSYKRAELLDFGLWGLSQQKINHNFEVIVINDGIIDSTVQVCKKYYDKLNIKYIFTGYRNTEKLTWRSPSAAINSGVHEAKGQFILLTSPEILVLDNCIDQMIEILEKDKKALVVPYGKSDNKKILKLITDNRDLNELRNHYDKLDTQLDTNLPFFMAMSKNEFNRIGGYDEELGKGYCFDDSDFVDRLLDNNCHYVKIGARVIHLFHTRDKREGLSNKVQAWQANKTIYDKKVQDRLKEKEEMKHHDFNTWYLQKIPKIAHFYWGEEKLPYLRYLTIESFINNNPDWEVRFYIPKFRQTIKSWNTHEHKYDISKARNYYSDLKRLPIKMLEIDFRDYGLDNNLSEVHKSDYLRWYLLSIVGGMWADMDIIFTKSMNYIDLNRASNKEMNTLICYHSPWKHSIGFLLSSPNNSYYKEIWEKAKQFKYDSKNYQTVGSLLLNATMKSPDDIESRYADVKIGNISMETVYAYNSFMIKSIYNSQDLSYFKENTIGLHWYAGHPNAEYCINNITENTYKKTDNVLTKTIDIAVNTKKQVNIITSRKRLTIHSVIKNEPFIYYSIKSVYDYADEILLYDTGSDDKFTLEDINRLLEEDKEKKIKFKQFSLGFNENKWTYENVDKFAKENIGKFSVGKVRQIQLDDTGTEYCMIVDGDEVHYKETIEKIIDDIIQSVDKKIIGINIPLIWFYDLNYNFIVPGLENTGRIWQANKVKMNEQSPNEYHCFKDSGVPIAREDKEYLIYQNIKPYAHFETFLKPWRRKIKLEQLTQFKEDLPEVMRENDYYIKRYLIEKGELK